MRRDQRAPHAAARAGTRLHTRTRVAEIVGVLTRHALASVSDLLRRVLARDGRPPSGPRHLRDALAELGPTFIKLGQVLSTRPDLVPPRYEEALATLQDAAPPVPLAAVRESVRAELGRPLDEVFSSFDETPLAAASIGQVHGAVLRNGRDVVVKVRRPGVTRSIGEDLGILHRMARVASLPPGALRRIDLVGFVEEFGRTIRAELDYVAEGHSAERLRGTLVPLGVHVPEVVWDSTTQAVLTLERIWGAKINDVAALDAMGVDRPALAWSFALVYLTMVFADGFYHADPHPGNFFVEQSGRLAMVDFGMTGTVAPAIRDALGEILFALATNDIRRSAAALRELGVVPDGVDEERFIEELERLTAASFETPLGEMRLAPLLIDFMAVSRRHRLRFPSELALLVKTVVMCEGLAAQLDPAFALPVVLVGFVGSRLGEPPEGAREGSGGTR